MRRPARRSTGSFAIAIAVHAVVIAGLANMVFRYPLGTLLGIDGTESPRERLRFVTLTPRPAPGADAAEVAPRPLVPAPLVAPAVIPTRIPMPAPADTTRARAAGGAGAGFGVTSSPLATGIVPRQPDPRIPVTAGAVLRAPRTVTEDVDSIVTMAIGIYLDSVAIAEGRRKPGDWTWEGKDGEKWGWDQAGIRLGKYTIPNALLALLPLNLGSGASPIDLRRAASIRSDVLENAQRTISEDEFRAAVKRIRERKERENKEKAARGKDGKAPTVIP